VNEAYYQSFVVLFLVLPPALLLGRFAFPRNARGANTYSLGPERCAARRCIHDQPDTPSGWWLFLTATQSVLSITLIALFLLAVR